jgi:acetylornithine deacetylase/succinyl-diaminopimelate desuccinylase-like protein
MKSYSWIAGLLAAAAVACAQSVDNRLARDIFQELIEINTTDSIGDNTRAAEAMAARLLAAGFSPPDVQVLVPHPKKGNLVARLRGLGQDSPVLLLGHLDVVEARREDWSFDPFRFLEKDGFFYGRGTQDMKADDAILVANLIRLKREKWKPRRDLILALTSDEEGGDHNGVQWLLANRRSSIDAAYCINVDAGGGAIRHGKRISFGLQASEKLYADFRLEVKNSGGHSSLPVKDNAIYRLSRGLARLAEFDFPVRLNEVTHSYFERMSALVGGQDSAAMKAILATPPDPAAVLQLAATPAYNARLRTTCVATMIEGGHARNALPQLAAANVNCRLLPDEPPENVPRTLNSVLADPAISVTVVQAAVPAPASPLKQEIVGVVEKIVGELWPGVPVVPEMSTGSTDGKYFRSAGIPAYGVSGIFGDIDDVRAHGRDERIGVEPFYQGLEFNYRLLKTLP